MVLTPARRGQPARPVAPDRTSPRASLSLRIDEPSGSWSGLTSQTVSVVQFGAATSSPKDGDELLEPKSPVPASLLGDREVEEVQDVRVDVDEEALEASRPAVDDAPRRARRVGRHLRQPDLFDPEVSDRPSFEVGRAAVREQEDLIGAQHRRPRADPGEAGNGLQEAEQVGDAHPVERTVLDALGVFRSVS